MECTLKFMIVVPAAPQSRGVAAASAREENA
jgi:hypothetical protein